MRLDINTLKYILLLIAQILLWNFFNFSQYLMISFLPVMILMMPINRSTNATLILAFLSGLAVDFFADGQLGLSIAALLPVALLRRPVIMFVFGNELFSRGENLSTSRQGWEKIIMAIIIATAIFLFVYIMLDSAGTRAFWVDMVKFLASLPVSTLISFFVADILSPENESKWK